jgi:C-1 hydroxylase
MAERAGDIVRAWFAAVDRHDIEAAAGLVAPAYVNHSSPNQGRDGLRAELTYWLTAFPDASVPVEDLIVDGDRVAVRHLLIGTHRGEFLGVAATERRISVQEMDIFRVEGGLIMESWSAPDLHGMLRQLGALP